MCTYPRLKVGNVAAYTVSVRMVQIASGQSIPDQPPIPALRIMESSFGKLRFSRWDSARMEARLSRLAVSARMVIRVETWGP